jgi:hypothetical protein
MLEFGRRDGRTNAEARHHCVDALALVGFFNGAPLSKRRRLIYSTDGTRSMRCMGAEIVHSTWRALGQAVLIYLSIGSCALTAQQNQPARETFGKMIAFARLASVACERLALRTLIKPPLTEKEIVAKEKDVKQLRVRLGFRKWCQRYTDEMAQARILVEVLRKQN